MSQYFQRLMVTCPYCGEQVDREMASEVDGRMTLTCWDGHRFGLDGLPAPASDSDERKDHEQSSR